MLGFNKFQYKDSNIWTNSVTNLKFFNFVLQGDHKVVTDLYQL